MRANRQFSLRALNGDDASWVRAFIRERWAGTDFVVAHGEIFHPHELPGYVAVTRGGERLGLVTYAIREGECEVVTLNSTVDGTGVGSALLARVGERAAAEGCRRVWLITTNDNRKAIRFYEGRGYRIVAIRRGALAATRKLKPSLPLVSEDGIPLEDEIEFELVLPPRRDPNITHWDGPPLEAWRPWTPDEVASVLAGTAASWCVVGGWAIDLALGGNHRKHEDIEIAIPRAEFSRLRRQLAGYRLHTVGDGEVRALPPDAPPPAEKHQNWVLDPVEYVWRMDVMLEPGSARTWVFRRDERVKAPRARMVTHHAGIPCLTPAAALLYKAKARRGKDEADFKACLPLLDQGARVWLRSALEIVHPEHPWIAEL